MKTFYLYIMSNKRNGTLYIACSSHILKRVWAHKNNLIPKSFTARYHINNLVHYEIYNTYEAAARCEKRLKRWCRQCKLDLIDIYDEIFLDPTVKLWDVGA